VSKTSTVVLLLVVHLVPLGVQLREQHCPVARAARNPALFELDTRHSEAVVAPHSLRDDHHADL